MGKMNSQSFRSSRPPKVFEMMLSGSESQCGVWHAYKIRMMSAPEQVPHKIKGVRTCYVYHTVAWMWHMDLVQPAHQSPAEIPLGTFYGLLKVGR